MNIRTLNLYMYFRWDEGQSLLQDKLECLELGMNSTTHILNDISKVYNINFSLFKT